MHRYLSNVNFDCGFDKEFFKAFKKNYKIYQKLFVMEYFYLMKCQLDKVLLLILQLYRLKVFQI